MMDRPRMMEEIRAILRNVENLSVEEIAEAIGCDYGITLCLLREMDCLGQVEELDYDSEIRYRLLSLKEFEPPPVPVIPPEDTCLKAPILRRKRYLAQLRDREEHHQTFM